MYDTVSDPYNLKNVISDENYAAARNALHDELLDWMNRTRDPFRGYQWQCRPWRKDKRPSWNVDGYTRQRENDPGEYRQLDYSTGLTMKEAMYLQKAQEKWPLQVHLRNILIMSQMGDMAEQSGVDDVNTQLLYEALKYAIIVVSAAPLLILYPFVQRFFEKGIMMGSIKG